MRSRYLCSLLLVSILLFGCSGQGNVVRDGKVSVVVSIEPVAAFVEAVGKERVRVSVMVPKGASPHTYEPRPSQLRTLSSADLYAKVGAGIEFERTWMARLVKLNPGMLVTDCSKGVRLLGAPTAGGGQDAALSTASNEPGTGKTEPHKGHGSHGVHEGNGHSGGFDPHIWVSPKNAVIMVENIYAGLVEADPEGKEQYRANKDEYIKKLNALDYRIRSMLKDKRGTRVITYHPAWGYFAAEYGLIEVPIEFEGKPPAPRSVVRIIERARLERSETVFTSPQFSRRAAEVIAKETGGRVVSLSPLERDYIKNMERVATAFSKL